MQNYKNQLNQIEKRNHFNRKEVQRQTIEGLLDSTL